MASIDEALKVIREAHKELGSLELSRLAGIPLMTVRTAANNDFDNRSIAIVRKLEGAAKAHLAAKRRKPRTTKGQEAA